MLIIEDGELLLCLKKLYDFESPRVSGAHGGIPKFNPWSEDDVLQNTSISKENLDLLLSLLKEKRQIISIPAYGDLVLTQGNICAALYRFRQSVWIVAGGRRSLCARFAT